MGRACFSDPIFTVFPRSLQATWAAFGSSGLCTGSPPCWNAPLSEYLARWHSLISLNVTSSEGTYLFTFLVNLFIFGCIGSSLLHVGFL